MARLFTPEGASGRAITEFSCEAAMQIGKALALLMQNRAGRPAKIVVGRDTRLSGEILTNSFAAGCCAAGADVRLLGIITTPAVSCLAEKYSADAGVMITASHNTYEFNGIKIFDGNGYYLSLDLLQEIERLVTKAPQEMKCSGGDIIGNVTVEKNAEWDYIRTLMKQIDGDLAKMRIAIDCANGAVCSTAEKFFRGIGATTILINNAPDGKNINDSCGTVNTEQLAKCVVDNRCHAGLAFDGDGSRVIILDEKGRAVDGNRLTAILAYAMKTDQKLNANTCVVSQTTNLGFFRWAKENGIVVSAEPGVGIRYIVERMLLGGYNLGASSSGHLILLDAVKTADGQLAAGRILEILARSQRRLSELAGVYEPYPQIALNVRLRPEFAGRWHDHPSISEIIDFCSQKLEGDGRVFVRESTASPVLRIMAEGRDYDTVWQYAQAIAKTVRDCAGYPEDDG